MKPYSPLDSWLAGLGKAETDEFPDRAVVYRQHEELARIASVDDRGYEAPHFAALHAGYLLLAAH